MSDIAGLQPGDLIATRSESATGWWIRLGAAFQDKPNLVNHIIIVHHRDKAGKLWGIEGRPSGVGWKVITPAIMMAPYTMDNHRQRKTDEQRAIVTGHAVLLLGTPYDWQAIFGDGLDALRMKNPWDHLWEKGQPGHVVCSSAADYLYDIADLVNPNNDQNCTPGDWAQLWIERSWA